MIPVGFNATSESKNPLQTRRTRLYTTRQYITKPWLKKDTFQHNYTCTVRTKSKQMHCTTRQYTGREGGKPNQGCSMKNPQGPRAVKSPPLLAVNSWERRSRTISYWKTPTSEVNRGDFPTVWCCDNLCSVFFRVSSPNQHLHTHARSWYYLLGFPYVVTHAAETVSIYSIGTNIEDLSNSCRIYRAQ